MADPEEVIIILDDDENSPPPGNVDRFILDCPQNFKIFFKSVILNGSFIKFHLMFNSASKN